MLEEQSIRITEGQLTGDESWVYVWVKDNRVLYVGATRLPLSVRSWLHLTDADPEIGKIRAQHPEALRGQVTVRGWRLPDSLDRAEVRDTLSASLTGEGQRDDLNPEVRTVVNQIAESIQKRQ